MAGKFESHLKCNGILSRLMVISAIIRYLFFIAKLLISSDVQTTTKPIMGKVMRKPFLKIDIYVFFLSLTYPRLNEK